MKRTLLVALAALACFLFFGGERALAYKPMTVRFACSLPPGTFQSVPLDKMIEIVERESGGQISCERFYGGVLGDEQAVVKQLRSNEIQIGVLAAGNLTPFAAKATLVILPYIFPKKDDAFRLFSDDAFMKTFADEITAQSRTRPLAWLVGGYRVLTNSKRPILTLEDMRGLKWRVPPVELQLATFRAWGVEPHPLAWIETFNGLQQGVIDGQENPHLVNRDAKFYEVQKYITDIHYMLWVGPILASERWYAALDSETRALFDRAARDASRYQWQWADKEDAKALHECLDAGMVLNGVKDEGVWQKKARSVWPGFYGLVGGKDFVDKALAIMGQ